MTVNQHLRWLRGTGAERAAYSADSLVAPAWWFDEDDAEQPFYWDGSAWVEVGKASSISGTIGRVARFTSPTTIGDANLVGPAANLLTLAATVPATLTVPETLTVAGRNVANTFSYAQRIDAPLSVDAACPAYTRVYVAPAVVDNANAENYAMEIYPTYTPTSDIAKNYYGLLNIVNLYDSSATGNLTATYTGGSYRTYTRTSTRTVANVVAGEFIARHLGAGSVYGNITSVDVGRFRYITGGGITTNVNLLHLYNPTGAGMITNLRGIYIDSLTAGTANNHVIYTNDGLVRFGDDVLVGAAVSAAQLTVKQSSLTGAQPVLYLDQRDVSKEALIISYGGADVDMIIYKLDVTGGPQHGWDESEDRFTLDHGLAVGDGTNQVVISGTGVVTLEGTAQRVLTIRPEIDVVTQVAHAKPTEVQIGVFLAYSFPIFAADDEELFLHSNVPGRWTGSDDITFHLLCAIGGAEDVGDYFRFQASWNVTHADEIVPTTFHDVEVEQAVLVGRNALNDAYELTFVIDYDADGIGNEIAAHDLAGIRLRRIDATNPDVTNEVRVLDWHLHYPVDKMFVAP